MIIHGLGPLGCIPSQRVKSKSGQCLKRVNEWVLEFNARVQRLITSLNQHLPKAQLVFADTYPAVLDLIINPSKYGKLKSPPSSIPLLYLDKIVSLHIFFIIFDQVSKSPILHAAMQTRNWGDFACQTPICARIAMNMCSGTPFIRQMQQMQCLRIIYSPAYLLMLLPLHQHPNNPIESPVQLKSF